MKNNHFLSVIFVFTMIISLVFICGMCLLFSNYFEKDLLNAYFSAFSFDCEFETDNHPFSEYYFNTLSDKEKCAYVNILKNIKKHPKYIKIPKLSNEEFHELYFAVKNDNPDILCFPDSCSMISFLSSGFLKLNYQYDTETCDSMSDELFNVIDDIVNCMDLSDEYAAELKIHDYIVKNCKYDVLGSNASNAYGCIIEGKAVCSGYSRAMMLLLKKAGINSILIGGTGITADNKKISHMWNAVWIENSIYYVDVTWDDTDSSDNSVSHIFFNNDYESFSFDHTDMSAVLDCNSNEYNYFVAEKLLFDSYSDDIIKIIGSRLKQNIENNKNFIEIKFSDVNSFDLAVKSLIENTSSSSDIYKLINSLSTKDSISHINFVQDRNKKYMRIILTTEEGSISG